MEDKLKSVQEILHKYHQEHLIFFYDELSDSQKNNLLDQILSIDFDEILNLYDQSKYSSLESTEEIAPQPYFDKAKMSKEQIEHFSSIGKDAIKANKVAVITLAGGQGSRLGFKGPKGTFELDLKIKKSLFEVVCDNLKLANKEYGQNVMWYIMTSTDNHDATVKFFEEKNCFDYPKENIIFFKQHNLPLIDINRKLLLEEIYKVKIASNGNGDLFNSLKEYGLLEDMKKRNIEWTFVGGVDNVLSNPLDPLFIGLTIASKNDIGAKTIFKEDPDNISWIFAKKDGRPSIVDCENFVSQLSKLKDDNGNYLYREINILAHLFSVRALEQLTMVPFGYHRAFKKNAFVNDEGMKQVPDSPNTYKFEKFVFDAFSQFDDMLLLRVNPDNEFAPIKDYNGPYNPEAAKKAYEKNILHLEVIDEDDD